MEYTTHNRFKDNSSLIFKQFGTFMQQIKKISVWRELHYNEELMPSVDKIMHSNNVLVVQPF